jgi:L-threonylcarbamoyladenylate synthase
MSAYHTRVASINPANFDTALIEEAAALIRAGLLVAFPTETVYGLGANAFDPKAVARIFEAKGRPATDPLIVHIASSDMLGRVAHDVPDLARTLMAAFWPGPLTLVLRRQPQIVASASAGLQTVAVRMPAHPVALALITAAGVPIAAPSANLFGHASPTSARHVLADLDGRLPLILDAGPTTIGLESTILDVTGDHLRLLRPGGIPLEAIQALLPEQMHIEVVTRFAEATEQNIAAPGMLLKHYSPRAEMHLFDGPDGAVRAALRRHAESALARGQRVGLLIAQEDRVAVEIMGVVLRSLGSLDDLQVVAHELYAGLRWLDDQDVTLILARDYPPIGIGLAIRDRLLRAASGNVTTLNV